MASKEQNQDLDRETGPLMELCPYSSCHAASQGWPCGCQSSQSGWTLKSPGEHQTNWSPQFTCWRRLPKSLRICIFEDGVFKGMIKVKWDLMGGSHPIWLVFLWEEEIRTQKSIEGTPREDMGEDSHPWATERGLRSQSCCTFVSDFQLPVWEEITVCCSSWHICYCSRRKLIQTPRPLQISQFGFSEVALWHPYFFNAPLGVLINCRGSWYGQSARVAWWDCLSPGTSLAGTGFLSDRVLSATAQVWAPQGTLGLPSEVSLGRLHQTIYFLRLLLDSFFHPSFLISKTNNNFHYENGWTWNKS